MTQEQIGITALLVALGSVWVMVAVSRHRNPPPPPRPPRKRRKPR